MICNPTCKVFDAPKLKMYIVITYFDDQSEKLKKELKTLAKLNTYINFLVVLINI